MRWFETDASGLPVGPIFKGQAVQGAKHLGQLDHHTLRNNTEDGRIQTEQLLHWYTHCAFIYTVKQCALLLYCLTLKMKA